MTPTREFIGSQLVMHHTQVTKIFAINQQEQEQEQEKEREQEQPRLSQSKPCDLNLLQTTTSL